MDDETNRVSLYRRDWFDNHWVNELENSLAKGYCVAFNSVQSAVQGCLELLGTRETGLVVIMSVTAGPDEMAAVLRSGANPILLDIEEEYLQINPETLKEVLPVLEEDGIVPIMLLDKPVGDEINPAILAEIQDLPSISVYRGFTNQKMDKDYFSCAFNIIDFTDMVGGGAVIFHSYPEQIKHLKLIRSGIMGMGANMPEGLAQGASVLLNNPLDTEAYADILDKYVKSDLELSKTTKFPSLIWVKVKDAKLTATHLKSYGIDVQVAMCPLYELDEIRKRFQQDPDYPVAEKLKNQYICVPTHIGAVERTDEIIKLIGEIND